MIYRITLTYQLSVSIHSCLCSSTLRQSCHNIVISYTCKTKKSLTFTIKSSNGFSLNSWKSESFLPIWKLRQYVCGHRHPIFFKTELLSISVGLWMYPDASPFSLLLAILVRDQVFSLLSELKFLKKKGQNQDKAVASLDASYSPGNPVSSLALKGDSLRKKNFPSLSKPQQPYCHHNPHPR